MSCASSSSLLSVCLEVTTGGWWSYVIFPWQFGPVSKVNVNATWTKRCETFQFLFLQREASPGRSERERGLHGFVWTNFTKRPSTSSRGVSPYWRTIKGFNIKSCSFVQCGEWKSSLVLSLDFFSLSKYSRCASKPVARILTNSPAKIGTSCLNSISW